MILESVAATADITNNIIWGNVLVSSGNTCKDVLIDNNTVSTVQFRSNDTTSGGEICSTTPGFVTSNGSVTTDPLFVNAGTDDYRITLASPVT